jgi:hypothetical protein
MLVLNKNFILFYIFLLKLKIYFLQLMKPTKSVDFRHSQTMIPGSSSGCGTGDLSLLNQNYKYNYYLDENNIIKSYGRKERKNFSLYDVHKLRKEEFEVTQEKENLYHSLSKPNLHHLLNGVNIYKLKQEKIKDLRFVDYRKDLSQKISIKKKNSLISSNLQSPYKDVASGTVSYKKSHLDFKIKQLYFDLKELETKSSNENNDKPYMMISRYLIFTQNLLSNKMNETSQINNPSLNNNISAPLLKKSMSDFNRKFTDEMDYFNLYTKALKESVKQIIDNHKNNTLVMNKTSYPNFKNFSKIYLKEIQPNPHFEEVLDKVYRNIIYTTEKNLIVSEEKVLNLISKELTYVLNNKIKVDDEDAGNIFDSNLNVKCLTQRQGHSQRHMKHYSVDLPNIKSAVLNMDKPYTYLGNNIHHLTQNIQKSVSELTSINENKESESNYITSDNTTFENIGKNIENQIKINRERGRKSEKVILEYSGGKLYPVVIKEKSFDIFGREITVTNEKNEFSGNIQEDNVEESVSLMDEKVSEEEYSDKEVSFSGAIRNSKKKGRNFYKDENGNIIYTSSTDKNATHESIVNKKTKTKFFINDKNIKIINQENKDEKNTNEKDNNDVNLTRNEDLQNTFIDNKIKNSNFKLTLSNFNSRKASNANSKENSKNLSNEILINGSIYNKSNGHSNIHNSEGENKENMHNTNNTNKSKINISNDKKNKFLINKSKIDKSKDTSDSHTNENDSHITHNTHNSHNTESHNTHNTHNTHKTTKEKLIENKPREKENILSDLFKRKSQEERRKESEISDLGLTGRETNDNSPLLISKRNASMMPSPMRNATKLSVYSDLKDLKNSKSKSISSATSTINTSHIKTKTKNSLSSLDRDNDDSDNSAITRHKKNNKSISKRGKTGGTHIEDDHDEESNNNSHRHKSSTNPRLNLNSILKKGTGKGTSGIYNSSPRKTQFNTPVVVELNEDNNQLTFEGDDSDDSQGGILELESLSSSARRKRAKTTYSNYPTENDNTLTDRTKNNSEGFKKNFPKRRTAIAFDKQKELERENNLKVGKNITEYVNSLEKNESDAEEVKKEVKKELDLVSILAARNMKRFSSVQTAEQMKDNINKSLELKKLVEKSQQKEERTAQENMNIILEAIQKNEKKSILATNDGKTRPSQLKPKRKKGARKTVTDEEKKEFHEKMMKVNEMDFVEIDEEMQEELKKKKLLYLYNLDQDLNYLMQKSESERKRYEEIKEKLDSLKNFDSQSYVQFLEKNYKNIKNEMEVRMGYGISDIISIYSLF